MKIHGEFDKATWYGAVTINGMPLLPYESQKVRNHSPDGFAWGYGGSGPSQLALAILLTVTDKRTAQKYYQDFKREFIQNVPNQAALDLEVDVHDWLRRKQQL